jgi:hypothetical protein
MLAQHHSDVLRRAGFEMPKWCISPSEDLVTKLEREHRLVLPSDYREFLLEYGGCVLDASASFLEPTPFGESAMINSFFGFMPKDRQSHDVSWNTRLIEGAPDFIAIAGDLMGGMIWLGCAGALTGKVYYHDPEQRWTWSDNQFKSRFALPSSSIDAYLAQRRAGALPAKQRGFENIYLLGNSFSSFLGALRPESADGDA